MEHFQTWLWERELELLENTQLNEGFWRGVWGAAKTALGLVGAAAHGTDAALATAMHPFYGDLVGGHPILKKKVMNNGQYTGRMSEIDPYYKQKWQQTGDSLKWAGKGFVEFFDELFGLVDKGVKSAKEVLRKLEEMKPGLASKIINIAQRTKPTTY